GLAVEDAQHGILAVDAGHDGNAHVDLAPERPHLEAAVLRDAAFGDVEFGHDLDARDGLLRLQYAVDAAHHVEHAVDAVLDGEAVRLGFHVDVAGAGLERVVQRGAHELDHGARVLGNRAQRDVLDATAVAVAV